MAKKKKKPRKLTPKQAVFVKEYLKDLNATQAAIRAGYAEKNAGIVGYQLLQKTLISDAIQAQKDKRAERTDISIDRVLLEYKRLATFDLRKAFGPDGELLPIHELDDDTAAAISAIESDDLFEGFGEERKKIGVVRKIKTCDKRAALSDVMKHLGGFEKDNAQRNDVAVAAAAALAAVKAAKTGEDKIRSLKNFLK